MNFLITRERRGNYLMCKLYPIELILLFEMIGYEDGAVYASLQLWVEWISHNTTSPWARSHCNLVQFSREIDQFRLSFSPFTSKLILEIISVTFWDSTAQWLKTVRKTVYTRPVNFDVPQMDIVTVFNFWSSHHKNSGKEIEKDFPDPVRHYMSGTGPEMNI